MCRQKIGPNVQYMGIDGIFNIMDKSNESFAFIGTAVNFEIAKIKTESKENSRKFDILDEILGK